MPESKEHIVAPATRTLAILMPLPDHDFDPTEAAIPWKACSLQGWKIAISTETGNIPEGDLHRLEGPLPGLLSASQNARLAYREMTQDPAYRQPIPYEGIDPSQYEALLLPGGDGLRVRQYLDNSLLRSKVLQFYEQHKLIGQYAMESWCWREHSITGLGGASYTAIRSLPYPSRLIVSGTWSTAGFSSMDTSCIRVAWLMRYATSWSIPMTCPTGQACSNHMSSPTAL